MEIATEHPADAGGERFIGFNGYFARVRQAADALRTHRPVGVSEAAIEAAPGVVLHADLTVPECERLRGAVVFAHASRLTRRDARNRVIVDALNCAGFATLLVDVFTLHEKVGHAPSADIELLAKRVVAATHWLRDEPETATLMPCYLGASGVSSAAALLAAAELREQISAVVAWGADSIPASAVLGAIVAPVLLVVDGDEQDLERGYEMRQRLACRTEVAIVPGATHTFDHAGPVQRAARLAAEWLACLQPETAPVEEPILVAAGS